MRKFDLNIDKMLENWEAYHAIREIIANALDEQVITNSNEVEIFRDDCGILHIRDFGRGLKHEHFTMNENEEKLNHPNLIGKFGVGLKDALATFDRLGISVEIKSKYCDVTFSRVEKHDFSDVVTLHACIDEASDSNFIGTDFIINGCSDEDVETAKRLFLKFSNEKPLEKTIYGEILKKNKDISYIYINGIRVAEEDNFLFSYNITSLTSAIKKALNRERTNVGRTAYSERIKTLLLASSSEIVAIELVKDLNNFSNGTLRDELKWSDVAIHAAKIANTSNKVLFITADEIMKTPRFVEEAQSNGYQIITIPENLKDKLSGQTDINGNSIQDLSNFVEKWNDAFVFKFVNENDLSINEKNIFRLTSKIINLADGSNSNVKEIKISETMRSDNYTFSEALGLWDGSNIIIKRSQLSSIETYSATLLHELAHARSGATDVTIDFEHELTSMLGKIASNAILNSQERGQPKSQHTKKKVSLFQMIFKTGT